MKTLLLTIILSIIMANSMAQNKVYKSNGQDVKFSKEDIDITFQDSEVTYPGMDIRSIVPVLPAVVDIAFQLTNSFLENRAKKFTAEYSKQKSNINITKVPDFTFTRQIQLKGSNDYVDALKISFTADNSGENTKNAMVYYVESIQLKYAAAKAQRKNNHFDYTIEIKPTVLLKDGKKKVLDLSPIVISSVGFNEQAFVKLKHRSDIILLGDVSSITEVSVKIIESNPAQVRAERILSEWQNNKESIKTIVNNYLPKEEDEDSNEK